MYHEDCGLVSKHQELSDAFKTARLYILSAWKPSKPSLRATFLLRRLLRLPPTVRTKPEYKGNANVQLRVDFARGSGWSGVVFVDGHEIKITGPYRVQKKVAGLIIPAGVGRGEWEWKPVNGTNALESPYP